MRSLVLLAVAACSSKPSQAVTPAGSSEPPLVARPAPTSSVDATTPSLDAPPSASPYVACAANTLPATDRRDVKRAFTEGACQLRHVSLEDPEPGLAAILGRPLTREEERVVAFEAGSRDRFEALVACNGAPPRVSYSKEHVWFVVVYGMGTEGDISSIYDDGKTVTLVVSTSSRAGCGGRAYGFETHLDTVLVPANRIVSIMPCANDPHCTGLEK